MRRILLLLCALACALPSVVIAGGGGDDKGGDEGEILRRSFDTNPFNADPESYPGGPASAAPLSTGYYVVDNDAPDLPALWTPTFAFIDTTGLEQAFWRRIVSGPNQRPASEWTKPTSLGYEFFRNPGVPNDSTDNAIAGPMSIGFPFYYYGRAYDSFYVSTNGLIGLSNRRYQYDDAGNRVDYNPFRDDSLTRPRVGANAQVDPTPDDYGYAQVALGGFPGAQTPGSANAIAGLRNPGNAGFPTASSGTTAQRSVIAALWDDQELSQFDTTTAIADDFGKVYWRRDQAGNRLIIYYVNLSMKNAKWIPLTTVQATPSARLVRANFQVVLDRVDSSVQINYTRFLGQYTDPVQRIFSIPASSMYRANATIAIQSNPEAPVPYIGGIQGAQYTNYQYNDHPSNGGRTPVNGSKDQTPHANLAVKFRQWANKVRVMQVNFQIPDKNDATKFVNLPNGVLPNNYELLLGNPVLGVVRPVGIVENVSDSIGPVNRTPQPVKYNIIFRIRDVVNVTNPPVYQKTNTTIALSPIRATTAANKSRDTVVFDPYVTNAQLIKQAGRFRAEVIATDRGPNGEIYGDVWPFDDTTSVRIFGIYRQEVPYITTFNDFSVSPEDGVIPNVRRWVSIGGQVVDGDQQTYNPPPPRGPATGSNGNVTLQSPVLKMDRQTVEQAYYLGPPTGPPRQGDTLISFPINISTVNNPVVILSYERAGKQVYPRGWSDQVRLGPEHATYTTVKNGFYQIPDYLQVQFAEPSPNGIDNITNITYAAGSAPAPVGAYTDKNWMDANFGDPLGTPRYGQTSPRWGVFGGGGGSGTDTTGKLQVNEFDAGKDFEFGRAYIPIPSRWTKNLNANKNFRFRVILIAKDDKDPIIPSDDEDAFFVDNIYLTNIEKPELEITSVSVDWPYTIAPASQARAIPLKVKVSNNGSTAATSFGMAMYVVPKGTIPQPGNYSYYRFRSVISLGPGQDRTETFPVWNAQECGTAIVNPAPNALFTNTYRVYAQLLPQGLDAYSANDLNYTDFDLTLGPVFAYDDNSRPDGKNDVATFSGVTGRGLNLVPALPNPAEDANAAQPYGPPGGSQAGSFAMQFRILTRDTVRGFQAYFGAANQSQDNILYAIYKGKADPNAPPDLVAPETRRYARRGEGIPTKPLPVPRDFYFDQYVTYLLDTAYVVDPGLYFVSVSQLGETGIELGGSSRNMGQVTTIYDPPPAAGNNGQGNYSIAAHPEMRQIRFWFENIAETGNWIEMMQPTTNPGYPHLNLGGVVTQIPTYTRGSWIPMIRPYFGNKEAGACTVEPVELAEFNVTPMASALRLDWRTANEVNNKGFHVERRVKGEGSDWNTITFKEGAGTTNREQRYAMVDNQVQPDVTYQYRLRQEDRDGVTNFSPVREGRIAGATTGAMANTLEQNSPNPFSDKTTIGYSVAESGHVTLKLVDMYGNTVRAYELDAQAGKANSVVWDGRDASGVTVANGVYVYTLEGTGFTLTRKLTVAR